MNDTVMDTMPREPETAGTAGTAGANADDAVPLPSTIPPVDRGLFGTPECLRIQGGAGTGKTESLIARTSQLLSEGTAPNELLVLCASPVAADAFVSRLKARVGRTADEVAVTTPRAVALDVLSQKEARAKTGRPARLLAAFEVNFLLEDMKTLGTKPGRLKEILKFFYRGWTELAEDDPEWLIMVEEKQLHALLMENLDFMQGMLKPELSKLAVGFLRADAQALKGFQRPHVLVDDLTCLNRASQLLAHLLASHSLAVAGDPCTHVEVFDPYPFLGGLDEVLAINPHTSCTTLTVDHRSLAVTAAQNALLDDKSMDGALSPRAALADGTSENAPGDALAQQEPGSVEVRPFETAGDEFEGVASFVKGLLATAGHRPLDVGIVTLHPLWDKGITGHLEARGLPSDSLFPESRLSGDIRDLKRSVPLRVYTALRLVADPSDAAAWRCWCGFGDYLAHSALFIELRAFARDAREGGIGLVRTLELLAEQQALATPTLPGAEKALAPYRCGLELIESCRGLTGAALLRRLSQLVTGDAEAGVPEVLTALLADTGAGSESGSREAGNGADGGASGSAGKGCACDGSAASMVALAEQRLFFPRFLKGDACIRMLRPQDLCSLSFKTLVVCGFVNGFLPCRDYFDGTVTPLDKQEKMHASDVRLLYLILSAAQDSVVFSHFKRIDIESAERLKLKVARIRFEKGERICLVTPSELLELLNL